MTISVTFAYTRDDKRAHVKPDPPRTPPNWVTFLTPTRRFNIKLIFTSNKRRNKSPVLAQRAQLLETPPSPGAQEEPIDFNGICPFLSVDILPIQTIIGHSVSGGDEM